jgi:hypothetical protein
MIKGRALAREQTQLSSLNTSVDFNLNVAKIKLNTVFILLYGQFFYMVSVEYQIAIRRHLNRFLRSSCFEHRLQPIILPS